MSKFKMNTEEFRKGIENDVQKTQGESVQLHWSKLKENILKNAVMHVGHNKGKRAKKPWITEGMLQKMRERRKWKSKHTEEGRTKYRQLNNELRRETEKAKAVWWERECEESEQLEKRGRADLLYGKVTN